MFMNFVGRFGPWRILPYKAAACFLDVDTGHMCGWYHGELGRPEAQKRLMASGRAEGKFLVRISGKFPKSFTVAILKVEGQNSAIRNVLLYNLGKTGYGLRRDAVAPADVFPSIQDFVSKQQ